MVLTFDKALQIESSCAIIIVRFGLQVKLYIIVYENHNERLRSTININILKLEIWVKSTEQSVLLINNIIASLLYK